MIDTAPFKERLETEKKQLETQLADLGSQEKATGDWQGATSDTVPAIDPNEAADQIEELSTNVSVVEELEGRYHEVLAALERIEKGTYGTCEESGEEIPMERLEANPAARTKVEHAS